MVDFVTRTAGWKVHERYQALNYDVNRQWDWNEELRKGSVTQLRQSVAIDPKLRVLIAHGWNDLSCPFMASVLTIDQIPKMGSDPTRIQVREYPGGHMFYNRRRQPVIIPPRRTSDVRTSPGHPRKPIP